ncbi:MAG: MATE family efflux transporter [Bacteroidota bacterium]|nr:MATE family efflux transporter [Bacteroidota bacterium]
MYSNKEIIKVAYPIFLSYVAQNVVNMTDTAFLGRVGEVELGASALGGVFYMSLFMIGLGFSIGSQILIARRNGEKQFHKIGEIFNHGLVFLIVLAIAMILLVQSASSPLLHVVLKSPKVYQAASAFLDIRIFGLLFIFLNSLFRALYIGITQTKMLIWNAVIMASVNIVLDYTLIFGHFGAPKMGIQGAALASVTAEGIALLFMVIYTLRKIDVDKYNLRFTIRLHSDVIRHILSVSIYTMIQSFLAIATWFIFFIGIEHLGERSLAVSNIVRSLYMIMMMPILSFGTTANTLVSNQIGAGGADKVMKLTWQIIRLAIYVLLPVVAAILIFPKPFIRIYTDNLSLMSDTIYPLLVLTSSLFLAAVSSIFFNSMSGTGSTRVAMWVEVLCIIVYVSYMWWLIMIQRASVAWCWTTEHMYWIVLLALCYGYMRRGTWQKKMI